MRNLEGILELVDKEFGRMAQNGEFRNKDDIELAYKLIDIAKDAYCIWDYEDKMEDGYSEGYGYSMNKYDRGISYARGRSMPRNTMGRFTSREGMTNPYRGNNYSRDDIKTNYLNQLYDMMESTTDNRTRDHIQKMINEMEQQ